MGYLKYFYWKKQSFYYGIPEVKLKSKIYIKQVPVKTLLFQS
jgi:hypothetical protein